MGIVHANNGHMFNNKQTEVSEGGEAKKKTEGQINNISKYTDIDPHAQNYKLRSGQN